MATRPPQKEVGSRRKVACFKNLLWDFMANGAFFIHLFTCFNILIDGVCCFRFLVGGFVAFFTGVSDGGCFHVIKDLSIFPLDIKILSH